MDRDTLNWLYRLLIAGAVFIAIYSIFDSAPFFVRAIGNVLVLGALLFLVDVQASNKFRKLFWAASTIWSIIVCHSAVGFVGKSPSAATVFQTITYSIYAIALLSVVLFSWAMRQLCIDPRLNDLGQSWKTITRVSATYYSLPFVAFLGMFVGRAVGAEVQLIYGVDETSSIPASVAQYLIRVTVLSATNSYSSESLQNKGSVLQYVAP